MSGKWKDKIENIDKEKLKQEIRDKAEALQKRAQHLLKEGVISDEQFAVLQQKAKHILREGLISDEQFASMREKNKHLLQNGFANREPDQDDENAPDLALSETFLLNVCCGNSLSLFSPL
ncbi:hypothetical protein [Cardiobacterium valvarum]|uniref:Uncharacterized protein n=1 Tax=Cardiobacterium valvarum TaxID=194702 RepID=A0A381E5P7_9GAMM|nr:hypothetical protein [Cardiobacterium valvarum]SUX21636.1 Uncharacterised protein [Cardiobacterium valvarum]